MSGYADDTSTTILGRDTARRFVSYISREKFGSSGRPREQDSGTRNRIRRINQLARRNSHIGKGLGGFHLKATHTDSAAALVNAREPLGNT